MVTAVDGRMLGVLEEGLVSGRRGDGPLPCVGGRREVGTLPFVGGIREGGRVAGNISPAWARDINFAAF